MSSQISPAESAAEVTLTWTVTDTYTAQLPLDRVAGASRHRAEVLAVDPAALHGAAGQRLIDLLAEHQDEDSRMPAEVEVEIIGAVLAAQPTLADLVNAARKTVQAECDADQHSCAGRALAALLAGLSREELIR